MILIKNSNKIEKSRAFLPMCYRIHDRLRQRVPARPNEEKLKTATNQLAFVYYSLPAPTLAVPTSSASIWAISRWLNGCAKAKPLGGCTARSPPWLAPPTADVSANAKLHSCNAPSCLRRPWRGLSSASAVAVLLRQQQTSARWIRGLLGSPDAPHLPSGDDAAIFDTAVAGFVQCDEAFLSAL